jgi:ligand-binding sensor domain-containing protein/signal transduction histidine kinase
LKTLESKDEGSLRRNQLYLCLWLSCCTIPSLGLADQPTLHNSDLPVRVAAQPITLAIVDAQDNRFLRLSTSEGISQTKVDSIVQDNQGFIWLGTRFGLYRYDGYAFKLFVHDAGNPNSLDGVVVRALFKDRDGILWVACDQSLNKFDQTTETFKRYAIPLVSHITQDRAGLVWLTTRSGLYSVDPASGQIQRYFHDPNLPSSLSSNDIAYCGEDKKGKLWVASEGHLDEFDRKTGTVARHIILPDVPGGFQFYEDHFGVFWIFHGSPNALAVFDRDTNTLTNYAFPKQKPTMMKVTAMLEDRSGALWISTHGLGLLKLDREHGRFIRYNNLPADPESLPQDKVDALLEDREGNIWVAPGRMAPALLATRRPPFNKLPKVPGSTIEPFVGALYEDRQRNLWIGTPEALIRRDYTTGRITTLQTEGPEVGADVVSICEDGSDNLWVGTYSHGLHRFDRRTGKLIKTYRHNPADPHSLSNDIVMRLFVDHNGTLWAGTSDGLDRFDPLTERFTTYRFEAQSSLLILELMEDRQGKLWIGTESSGLRQFDPATGQLAVYRHDRALPGTLSDNRVNSVHFDRSGTMWVGTQNGLNRFDGHTDRFSALTQRDGLPGNAVGCILEDKAGSLWMSTNNGVARFNSQSGTFTNFSTAEGLPGPNLTGWGACFQSPGGEMFFGGFNGGTSFFPEAVADPSSAPRVVLTDFRLFGNPVEIGAHSALQESISYTKNLTLRREQNVFSISFAALTYASPATNRYRYKLEGLERDWNEVGSDRREATYTTLPSRAYTFRVQGATRGGPWSEPGVTLRIEILPPWWNSRLFQAAVGGLVFLMTWAAYRYRLNQVAYQFETRLAERTRIAQDLHDTLLQGLVSASMQLHVVKKTVPGESLAGLRIGHVLELMKTVVEEGRKTVRGLRSMNQDLPDLENAFSHIVNEIPGPSDVKFRVLTDGLARPLHPVVQDEVYRIGREAILNAFRHASAKVIEASLYYQSKRFRLLVRDDGCGLDPEVQRFGREGHFGLPGMQERAERVGGRLRVLSRPGIGTDVELIIPGKLAYESPDSRKLLGWLGRRQAETPQDIAKPEPESRG